MFQEVIKHDQRFDFDRIPAVVELCWQAGACQGDENIKMKTPNSGGVHSGVNQLESLSTEDLRHIANKTLKTWETLRSGVEKLLLVYPAKVCEYCSEVHIGPTGHKARNCGVFKYESWRGNHVWKKAGVDNLVPPNIVWCRRPQDPPVLLKEMQQFYGHAPGSGGSLLESWCSRASKVSLNDVLNHTVVYTLTMSNVLEVFRVDA
ncbi:hypothetical protein K2173_027384 [Erythroxylum novogranatense]|uniref:APO domain-containing protein n=1 Tax=Erythroxylum novogranatense TaxID=1862640 RepID=A0AAV8TYU3_9ROSI|nr:hypothetical protein K2173_027384 [Erythroxylum novogranatense]